MCCLYFCLCLALLVCACGKEPAPTPAAKPVHYAEVTREAGLDFVHYNGAQGAYYYPETYGSGAAFIDYDSDGWQDIYLVNGAYLSGARPDSLPTNRLYRNTGAGKFIDATAVSATGDTGYGSGCAVADFDNDGDQDLYITNFGPNTLYHNQGNGRFVDITDRAGVGDERWSTSCGFLDYDLDGDLDLFATNYVDFTLELNIICQQGKIISYCHPNYYEPIGDMLYRNEGDGRFSEVTAQAGITLEGRGLGAIFLDYDLDGDTDVYVANDGTVNFLYENRRGRFVEVGLQAGVQYNKDGRAEAGMGVDAGDFDNDGDLDLIVANFAYETNTLYRNNARGRFHDASAALGLSESSYVPLGFSTKFLDYDNDEDLDLFVANGHIMDRIAEIDPDQSYAQPNQMLRNEAGARFADVSASLGPAFSVANVGRGAAVADYDNDGDLDLLVTTVAAPPRLLRNDGGNQHNWLLVHLQGAQQRDALGTRVTVTTAAKRQIRERQSGSGYLSSHDPRLHFGLGRATRADIEIRWPDGQIQNLSGVRTNQILHLVQSAR